MLDVEFILVVDDIEYQHRLLSRPKAEALLNSVHKPRAFNSSRRVVIYKQCMADIKNLASRKSWYTAVISHSQSTTTLSLPRFLKVENPGEIGSSSPTNDSDTVIETNRYDSTSLGGSAAAAGPGLEVV
jgi:hypothetical protein